MSDTESDIDRLVAETLAAEGVHESLRGVVKGYVKDRSDLWRRCCNTNCDPCVETIARLVDRIRAALDLQT